MNDIFNNIQELTPEAIHAANYYKVAESCGTLVTNIFYNPITKDVKHISVRDYDYYDKSRDNDDLYYMPIDEAARILYKHNRGEILPGDNIQIIKGRKYKHGTTGKVKQIKPFYDKYNRFICNYLYLESGEKVSADNCILLEN